MLHQHSQKQPHLLSIRQIQLGSWFVLVLVLLMTMPGLALFYGGLAREKNVLSVLLQCLLVACMTSIIWLMGGYSIAFGDANSIFGGFDKIMLTDVTANSLAGTIPEYLFFAFQMTFSSSRLH